MRGQLGLSSPALTVLALPCAAVAPHPVKAMNERWTAHRMERSKSDDFMDEPRNGLVVVLFHFFIEVCVFLLGSSGESGTLGLIQSLHALNCVCENTGVKTYEGVELLIL